MAARPFPTRLKRRCASAKSYGFTPISSWLAPWRPWRTGFFVTHKKRESEARALVGPQQGENRMMRGRKSLRFVLAGGLSTVGALPLAISQAIPGFESQSHVAKTA